MLERNLAKAFKWYKLSADGGNLNGQSNLGRFYENGIYVDKIDLEKAMELYRLASRQGQKEAENSLQRMLADPKNGLLLLDSIWKKKVIAAHIKLTKNNRIILLN